MQSLTAARFSVLARVLADEARRRGLRPPGFRSPPRLPGARRTIRRSGDAAVVAVSRADRPADAVVADMVEGVLVANGVTGADADRWRDELAASVKLECPRIPTG